ncbi:MAG: metallophosphoesterase family protein [bacterium]|nr:metallophosphoesterase family protein [bacterium]
MIYFTSDLHFYHDKVIQYANRPFYNADEMNRALIRRWNQKVGVQDEVYILGDITMKGPQYATEVIRALHGKKYLIRGNHDQFVDREEFDRSLFEWIKEYYELQYENQWFILFHYPIEEWNGFFRGAIHLHGHQHNHETYNYANLEKGLRRYDVGVDANRMYPVSIEEILLFFSMGNL